MSTREPSSGFQCATCGRWHDELMTDIAFQLPDDVFRLAYLERYRRVRHNADLCTLDQKRYFIRCVLPVPFTYRKEFFGWGVWIEVRKKHHDLYIAHFDKGGRRVPEFPGVLANSIRGYRKTLGLEVRVQLNEEQRPFVKLAQTSRHALAVEQRNGIDAERHHEIVAPHVARKH